MNDTLLTTGQTPNIMPGMGQGSAFALVGLSQILTTASKIDIVLSTGQRQDHPAFPFGIFASTPIDPVVSDPDISAPRLPGLAKGRVLRVATDFDAPIDWGR